MVYFVCTTWVVGSRIADELAKSRWSRGSAKHYIGCESNELSMHPALFSALRENQEV